MSSSREITGEQHPGLAARRRPDILCPMAEDEEPLLTIHEAYRAAYHFIAQWYSRERTMRLLYILQCMDLDRPGQTSDPATWPDWIASVEAARASPDLPTSLDPPLDL